MLRERDEIEPLRLRSSFEQHHGPTPHDWTIVLAEKTQVGLDPARIFGRKVCGITEFIHTAFRSGVQRGVVKQCDESPSGRDETRSRKQCSCGQWNNSEQEQTDVTIVSDRM